jgi:mycothiol synthase
MLSERYVLRTYQKGDEPEFFMLMELVGWPDWDHEKLKPWLFRILPHGWFMLIDQATGQIAASAMATHDPTWTHPFCGEVGWVAAHPDHQGKGLGMVVVASVINRFLEIGYPQIHLYTEHWRLAALKTYLKLGFQPLIENREMQKIWDRVFQQISWTENKK